MDIVCDHGKDTVVTILYSVEIVAELACFLLFLIEGIVCIYTANRICKR